MDMKSVIGCSNQTAPRQGLRGDRKTIQPTTRATRPALRNVGCKAAAEPATQDEVTAALEADAAPKGSNGAEQQAPSKPAQGYRPRREQIAKYQLSDLKVGEWYDGVVQSAATYGVFFDIGAGKAGLCHVSQLAEEYVSDGTSFLSKGEKRRVRILSVDAANNRVSVSLLEPNVKDSSPRKPQGERQERRLRSDRPGGRGEGRGQGGGRGRGRGARSEGFAATNRSSALPMPDVKVGDQIKATVQRIERYGLFMAIEEGKRNGLLTPENMAFEGPATEAGYTVGQEVEVWVARLEDQKIALSTLSPEERKAAAEATQGGAGGSATSKTKGPKAESGLSAMALAFQSVGLRPSPKPQAAEPKEEAKAQPEATPEPAAEAPSAPAAAPAPVEAAAAPQKPEEVKLDPEAVPSAQATPETPEEVKEEPASKEEAPVSPPAPEPTAKADSINVEDSLANLQPETPENAILNNTPPKEADLPEAKVPQSEDAPATIKESTEASLAQERATPGVVEGTPAAADASTSEPSNPVEAAVESAKDAADEAAKPVVEAAEEAKDTAVEAAQPAVEAVEEAKHSVVEASQPAVAQAKEAASTASQPVQAAADSAKPSAAAKSEAGDSGKAAAAAEGAPISAKVVKDLREKTGAGMMECKKALKETNGDVEEAITFLRKKGLAGADKKAGRIATEGLVASYIHAGSGIGVLIEVNCETDFVARGDIFKGLCSDLAMQIAAFGDVVAVSQDDIDPALLARERDIEMGKDDILSKPEDKRAMIVEGRIAKSKKSMSLMDQPYIKDNSKDVQSVVKETIAQLGENIKVRRFERYVLGEGVQKKEANLAKEVEEQKAKMKEEAEAKAAQPKEELPEPSAEQLASFKPDAKAVSELRKASGAGMMDCKKALAANEGDFEKSKDYLRKKGLASADKKAGRVASEGAVAAYIHGSRLGILVEVNCETDFVAKGDVFQTLAADIAMQLASNAQVEAISKDEFPQENLEKERQVALQMEDIQSKPENIREKIVDGRLSKFASERSLLEQPFIKDTKITVGQHIKETIAKLGEKISVRRFTRYNLGEGLAKKEENFAEEIAKASGAK